MRTYEIVIASYIFIVNVIAVLLMGIDKWKAKHRRWRIPERTLFLIVILGGSIGGIVGMYLFHHKTKHMKFVIGFPVICLTQILICLSILQ